MLTTIRRHRYDYGDKRRAIQSHAHEESAGHLRLFGGRVESSGNRAAVRNVSARPLGGPGQPGVGIQPATGFFT